MTGSSDARHMSERAKEVTEMFSTRGIRRLLTSGLVLSVLAVAMPAVSLAANVGGGP